MLSVGQIFRTKKCRPDVCITLDVFLCRNHQLLQGLLSWYESKKSVREKHCCATSKMRSRLIVFLKIQTDVHNKTCPRVILLLYRHRLYDHATQRPDQNLAMVLSTVTEDTAWVPGLYCSHFSSGATIPNPAAPHVADRGTTPRYEG